MSITRTCPYCQHVSAPGAVILAVLNHVSHEHFIARCDCPACGAVWDEFTPKLWSGKSYNRLVKCGRLVGELIVEDGNDYGRPACRPCEDREKDKEAD
jgi:hypothetical protein